MNQVTDALERALGRERARNAEQFMRWRFMAILGVFALNAAFAVLRPPFIGAPERREYTAIGDTVNVAARIEQLTKTYDAPILVSDETRRRVDAGVEFLAVEPIVVRGTSAPIRIYAVRRI